MASEKQQIYVTDFSLFLYGICRHFFFYFGKLFKLRTQYGLKAFQDFFKEDPQFSSSHPEFRLLFLISVASLGSFSDMAEITEKAQEPIQPVEQAGKQNIMGGTSKIIVLI